MEEDLLKNEDTKSRPSLAGTLPIGANDKQYPLYNLVDLHGGGELIPWMRYALNNGDYSLVDGYIETTVQQMMFNNGKGRLEAIAELVKRRNKERNERLSAFNRKKGKGKSEPNILDDFNQEGNQGDLKKALKLLDGGKGGKGESKYREIIWKYEDRGSMGENLVGCCLMQGSAVHCKLAIRLIEKSPGLVNDIFLSEDYYGLSPLHLAIVNEDPSMVAYLLKKGADVNQRCYGALFYPDDQVATRTDSMEHEFVDINTNETNYIGKLYFGEYPLAFCVCTEQPECYRILVNHRGTNPNAQDTNGNTVLHMAVIHENPEMFRLAFETGSRLNLINKQKLTPLTLAAKLAKKKMFEHILRLESTDLWTYGNAGSTQYPLAKIDTINQETGELNEDSALTLVTYGETEEHLELLDGLLEDILQAKWDAFGRRRWNGSLAVFSIYYIFYFTAFMCRPFSATTSVISGQVITSESKLLNEKTPDIILYPNRTIPNNQTQNIQYFYSHETCHLLQYFNFGLQGYARFVSEIAIITLIFVQIALIGREIYYVGRKRWWQVLKSFPAKIMYKVSMILTLCIVLVRMGCGFGETWLLFDNMFSLIGVLLTATHFLYFFRAVPFIGPFVLMIYRIVTRDISRFIFIYFIFIMGFSQAFYIIFQACERINIKTMGKEEAVEANLLANPFESFLRLFIATLGEDKDFYLNLNACKAKPHKVIGEILFVTYQMFVSLMQLNLLIAAMQRTYELIYRTDREPKRQWAQVILMIELSLKPKERLEALLKYSRPIGTDKQKRAFVVTRKLTQLSETEQQISAEHEREKAEAKKQLLKKRLRDLHKEIAKRPTTAAVPPLFSRLSNYMGKQKIA